MDLRPVAREDVWQRILTLNRQEPPPIVRINRGEAEPVVGLLVGCSNPRSVQPDNIVYLKISGYMDRRRVPDFASDPMCSHYSFAEITDVTDVTNDVSRRYA